MNGGLDARRCVCVAFSILCEGRIMRILLCKDRKRPNKREGHHVKHMTHQVNILKRQIRENPSGIEDGPVA